MDFISSAQGPSPFPLSVHLHPGVQLLLGPLKEPRASFLHHTAKLAALKLLMDWRAVKSLCCKGAASQPAVPGWHRLEVPPMPRAARVWGSSAKGRTHLRGSRGIPVCTGQWEEVQWEKTASKKVYLKFPCSTGASQGLPHRSGQATWTNPPKAAKHPPTPHRPSEQSPA